MMMMMNQDVKSDVFFIRRLLLLLLFSNYPTPMNSISVHAIDLSKTVGESTGTMRCI